MRTIRFAGFPVITMVIIGPSLFGPTWTFGEKGLLGGEKMEGGEDNGGEVEVHGGDYSGNSTGEILKGRGSRGVLGFLPGFKLGGGSGGGGEFGGLLRGLKGGGGGKGLFRGLGLGGKGVGGGTKDVFPEFPTEGNNNGDGGVGGYGGGAMSQDGGWGWDGNMGSGGGSTTSGGGSGGKGLFGGGLFKSPFGGGNPFKNLFGGGASGGKGPGKGRFRFLSRLTSDQPCAAGLGDVPIINKIPFIPQGRFPSFIPSGVNTCDATCQGNGEWRRVPPTKEEAEQMNHDNDCTYNWRDSLTGLPFLLFRCHCKGKCPPKKVRIGGIFSSFCENVSNQKTRCKCPYGQDSYKCTISLLPVAVPLLQRKKSYYCTCCNENASGNPIGTGGYEGGWGSPAPTVSDSFDAKPSTDFFGGYESIAETSGGYQISAATSVGGYEISGSSSSGAISGGYEGSTSSLSGATAASENVVREVPRGKPLGSVDLYEHL